MVDAASLAGAYQGLKAAKDLLSVAFEAKVDAEAKPKILAAQTKLGEVQDSLFLLREKLAELQDERDQLRGQLALAKAWESRAAHYELFRAPGDAVVYKFKGSPEHFACPSCFNKSEIHILQDSHVMSGAFRCTGCGQSFPVKPAQSWNR
jgi:hypothetical protein